MLQLSVIIPCYNEAGSLPNLVEICRNSVIGRNDIEFVFVNNGSNDKSADIFRDLLSRPENQYARMVNVPDNKGYGYGILQGLLDAKGQVLAWTHADLQTDPADVIMAYEKFKDRVNANEVIIKGSRKGRNLFDVFFTAGMSVISSALLSTWFSDINAQPKIFHRNFMAKMDKAPFDFSLDLYLLYIAKREGLPILSFPVYFGKRNFDQSKGGGTLKGKIKLIKRSLAFIFELRQKIKK